MSADTKTWVPLNQVERRILGVLVEKAKTTPDVYPLSLNALTTGCNQKSNRDPLMNLTEDDVLDTLQSLKSRGMVTLIQGGRVERWRHNLYDQWTQNKLEIAILAELLLRGPQTEGELRQHASRMEPIEDLNKLREVLPPLVERGLVLFLGPEGRRGTLIAHGFHAPAELEILRARSAENVARETVPTPSQPSPRPSGSSQEVQELKQKVADLEAKIHSLENRLQTQEQALAALKQSLGA